MDIVPEYLGARETNVVATGLYMLLVALVDCHICTLTATDCCNSIPTVAEKNPCISVMTPDIGLIGDTLFAILVKSSVVPPPPRLSPVLELD